MYGVHVLFAIVTVVLLLLIACPVTAWIPVTPMLLL